jgi:lysophospholipase L1-like esterase
MLLSIPLALLAVLELVARFVIGLGDPPLLIRDHAIDYMFAPSRCYSRFHNRVCYNRWSMRAEEFSREKQGCEPRMMVLGDSIINGGSLSDQSEIPTEIARSRLARAGVSCTVGNISAGSWGPANLLAYTRRFGWFDADVVVFVFGSADVEDLPDFLPNLGPDHPLDPPLLAVEELASRYLPRYLARLGAAPDAPMPSLGPASTPERRRKGIAALKSLLEEAEDHVPIRFVFLHYEAAQLSAPVTEEQLFAELSERTGARFVSLRTLEDSTLYTDGVHLNARGQAVLGHVIAEKVRPLLHGCPTTSR